MKGILIGTIPGCFVIIILFFFFNSKQKINNPKQLKISGAGQAIDAWYFQRAYPSHSLNMASYVSAFKDFNQNNTYKKSFTDTWKSLGPHNIGGRTLCLAFNPQNPSTMYAGSASGGLWRSYTGGVGANGWHYVPTGYPVLGVAAIAIAPDDSNVIYIGTGEVYNYQNTGTGVGERTTRGTYGIGILKSIDGGDTWTKSLDWSYDELKGVQDIVINPLNPKTVWAATSEGTYRSYDAGANWQLVHYAIMVSEIVMHPVDTNIIFLGCGNFGSFGNGIYSTTDGGKSFNKLTGGSYTGKFMLGIASVPPYTLYASVANTFESYGLFSTRDLGQTWKFHNNVDFAKWQGWYSHDVAVHPTDTHIIICAGVDIWKSTNSGDSLTQKSFMNGVDMSATPIGGPEGTPDYAHGDVHKVYYHPTDPNIIYFATDGGIFRSVDGGETFSGHNGMYQTTQFYADFSNSTTDSVFAIGGLQDNFTAIYEGNFSWRRVFGGDGLSTAIDPTDDNIVYASTQWLGYLIRSDDKGVNFNVLSNLPQSGNSNFASPYVLCPCNPDIIYAGRDIVYKSYDKGESWTATNNGKILDGNPVLKIAVSQDDCDLVYASTAPLISPPARIFKSIDGGDTWLEVSSKLPDRFAMDIVIDPVNHDIVYAVFSGFDTDHVYRTIDGGDTWSGIGNGLPDIPTNTLVIDPLDPSHLYVGNDFGVYYSVNNGNSWETFSEGLTDAVLAMDLSISHSNRKLRVATHGNGVYERNCIEPFVASIHEANRSLKVKRLYPNPATDHIYVDFFLQQPDFISITIINTGGLLVNTIENIENKIYNKGNHSENINIGEISSGNYFCIIETSVDKTAKKFTVVK